MKKIGWMIFLIMLCGCSVQQKRITVYYDEKSGNVQEYDEASQIISCLQHDQISTDLLSSKQFTLSFWFLPTSNYLNTTMFSVETANGYFMMSVSENSQGNRTGYNISTQNEKITSSFEDSYCYMDQWNQIVLTKSGKNYRIYLNGGKIAEGSLNVRFLKESIIQFGETNWYDDPHFEGGITSVQVSSYARSEEEIAQEFMKEIPHYYLDSWEIDHADHRIEDIILPDNPVRGMNITYSSNNEEVIEIDGLVHQPSPEAGNQDVDFTANIEIDGQVYSKTIRVTVPCIGNISANESHEGIVNQIGSIVNDGQKLPMETSLNEPITWTSEDVLIDNYTIVKQSEDEKIPAVLHAEIDTFEGIKKLDLSVTVLDQYVGYIMAYFDGEEGEEVGKLIYSIDGLHWKEFADTPILSSDLGTGRVRDPFIARDTQGNFLITATQGYDNPEIYFWQSEDLIELKEHKLLKVSDQNLDYSLTGERAWAPEMIYDPIEKQYFIFFSDPKGEESSGIYYVTTDDFEMFSYPKVYYSFDYPAIDASLVRYQDGYLMFYKDEREGAKTIFYSYIDSLSKGVKKVEDDRFISLIKNIEGPIAFKLNGEDKYLLYADNYPNAKFIAWEFSDITADLKQLDEAEYELPSHVRHGSVISVTKKELTRLLDRYGEN